MSWTCPSCETVWAKKPLVDGTVGCPVCGNVAAVDLIASRLAMEPDEPDGYAWWQAYRLDVKRLVAERDTLKDQRDQALDREERTALQLMAQGEAARVAEARVEAAEQAITAAYRELERVSDVRANRTKIIGKAALILATALTRSGEEPE